MGSGRHRNGDVERAWRWPTCSPWPARCTRTPTWAWSVRTSPPRSTPPSSSAGSIPLDKASRPEVLLAWGMNGEPLPPVHGAPVRVVVPGYIGARSIKWLERVEVRSTPWPGHFQDVVYRLLPEDGAPAAGVGLPLGLVALNSDVLSPADGDTVPAGPLQVRGYAFAGGERYVARVDVSVDGAGWTQAELLEDQGKWAWRQWRATVDLDPGDHEIVVRAWDSSAATQPADPAALWNPKGYVNNAQPRVRVHVKG